MHWSEERECSECGMILPINELTKFTETRVAGWSRGGAGTNPLRDVDLFLCGYCTDLRIRPGWGRRIWIASRPMLISTAVVTGLFTAAVLILPSASDDGQVAQPSTPIRNAGAPDPNLMILPASGDAIGDDGTIPAPGAVQDAPPMPTPVEAALNGATRSDVDTSREAE